jgi:phosphonate ABC transporter permease subunit PhnE
VGSAIRPPSVLRLARDVAILAETGVTMKAVVLRELGGPEKLVPEELPDPKPGAGEAVVGLRAAALNHRDAWIRKGLYAGITLPVILGSDGAGEVVSVGDGVDPSWIGRQVVINPSLDWGSDDRAQGASYRILGLPDAGTYAEYVKVPAGNLFQIIRYAVIPQIIPSFLSFTLLRWDINMRSATVIGFVAGGGIGFFVLETIRMGGYQQYAAALWAVAVVIILVDFISSRWRFNILKDQPKSVEKIPTWKRVRNIFYVLLGIAAFLYCWEITRIDLTKLFDPGPTFGRLLLDFIKIDLEPKVLNNVSREMIITTMQALMATTLGGILAIPFSFLAAKNLTGKSKFSSWIFYATRSMFNILRSIEALLYVAIFVYWVGIGPFAGMLALSVTTFALMGKLFSEAIENIDPGPIEATTATGANKLQTIVYAIVPQIVPPFLSYLIYQWDINIRMATIIGFAGGGGIGLMLSTFFGSLQYHKAGTVIVFIVVVVAVMDFASAKIRERFV